MEDLFDKIFSGFETGVNGMIAFLPIIIGAVLIVIGIRLLFKELGGNKIKITAKCVGVDWESSPVHTDSDQRPLACPILRVKLDGVEHDLFNKMHSSSFRNIREGMDVPIRINPDDPSDYYIVEMFTPARFCLVIGIVLMAFGIIAYRFFFR